MVKKAVKTVAVQLPDNSVQMSIGTLSVSLEKRDENYDVKIDGVSTIHTFEDLLHLRCLIENVLDSAMTISTLNECEDENYEDDCCVGPCYAK